MVKDYIEIFNNYALLEYNSQYSVIDAAIYLSKEDDESLANKATAFIIFTYTQILANLYSDQGLEYNSVYSRSGKKRMFFLNLEHSENYVNENKLFLYNLIYLYDMYYTENNFVIEDESISLYYTSSFNDVISKYISFCESSDDYDQPDDLVEYINNNYLESDTLLEIDNEIEIDDWKIDLYVCIYYYIDLINYLKFKGVNFNLAIVKIFLNVSIIYHYLDKLLNPDETYIGEISDYLTDRSNKYESDIVDEMMSIFYDENRPKYRIYYENNEGKYGYQHFELLFNMYELEDFTGMDFFEVIRTLNFIINGELNRKLNRTLQSIIHFLDNFRASGRYDFKFFYERFLSAFNIGANDILDQIDSEISDALFSNYFNCFFWLSFDEDELDEDLFIENFKNMINEINSVYINLMLQYKVKEILRDRNIENNAFYFYANQINLFKKLSILQGEYYEDENEDENEDESDDEIDDVNLCPDEERDDYSDEDSSENNFFVERRVAQGPFAQNGGQFGNNDVQFGDNDDQFGDNCSTIYLPNLTKIDNETNLESNDIVTIGHSTFGQETSPPIFLV